MGDLRDSSEDFEVEAILDVRQRRRGGNRGLENEYLIRWKGYGPDSDTWEPKEHLSGCERMVAEFEAKQKSTVEEYNNHSATELVTPPSSGRQYFSVIEESACQTLEAAEIITRRRLPVSNEFEKPHTVQTDLEEVEQERLLRTQDILWASFWLIIAGLAFLAWYYDGWKEALNEALKEFEEGEPVPYHLHSDVKHHL